jgi:hypothetical protein
MYDKTANGDFTVFNCIQRLDRDELGSRLGFYKRRLDCGVILAVIYKPDLDNLLITDFVFGASPRW